MKNGKNKIAPFFKLIRKAFSSILVVLTLFLGIVLILSAYADRFSPATYSAFPSYVAFLFPAFLMVNLISLLYWLVRRKWPFFIVIVFIAISWPSVNAFFPIHFKQKVPENAIKFVTFNVEHFDLYAPHGEKQKNPIVQYILDMDADIICLQEYAYLYVNGKPDIHEDFKKKYPYYRTDDVINVNNYKYNGLACFSKYPIIEAWRVPYYSQYNGSVVFKIDVNGKIITLINNHLETNRITKNDKEQYAHALNVNGVKDAKKKVRELTSITRDRLGVAFKIRAEQAKIVAEEINKASGHIIVCGDLNDPPNSYARYKIKGKLKDAFADTGFGMSHTYNENKFYFRIDHIFHTPNLKAYNCYVDDDKKYSDHYPMICYFTFNDK